jgi:hypothetical protein
MKKFFLALAVMLVASPAWATDVSVTCTHEGGGIVRIDYAVTGTPKVRAFALDITVDSGATIDEITNYKIGESNSVDPGYGIFPASFSQYVTVDSDTGEADWTDPNYSPLADPNDPGASNKGDLPQSGITIEMGALYSPTADDSPNAPPTSGTLCKIKVSGACTVSIAENATRGGIVLTDPAVAPNVTLSTCAVVTDCFPSTYSTYNDWKTMGKPDCWCAPPFGSGYQCDGDADGKVQGVQKYRVMTNDLLPLVNNWKTTINTIKDPCADLDHKAQGVQKYRVMTNDLNILINNWKKTDAQLPKDCPRPE